MIVKVQIVGIVSLLEIQEIRFMAHIMEIANRSRYLGKISNYKTWKRILRKELKNEN